MDDHFVYLVDLLLTESTLEAAIESRRELLQATQTWCKDHLTESPSYMMDLDMVSSPRKLVRCRICLDEDEDKNMEAPCSCCGSLKYAHRKCVQRWCNEKGDTFCEICGQQFKPGYKSAPSPLFHYGGIPMNFRGNWEFFRRDLHDPQFIAMVTTDNEFLDSDIDEYSATSSRGLLCCRIVAIIFIVLLILRLTLLVIISGAGGYSLTLFTLLMFRSIGILLPFCIMVKAFIAIQRRRLQQDPRFSLAASDEENDLSQFQPRSRFIQIW